MSTILWISDSPFAPTGWGRVTNEIVGRIASEGKLNVEVLAVGTERLLSQGSFPTKIWSHSGRMVTAPDVIDIIEKVKPGVVVTLCDIWTCAYMLEVVRAKPTKWIGYFPIDAGPLPQCFRTIVEGMLHCVTTSAFSGATFRQSFPDLDVQVIRHGVNTEVFSPGHPEMGKQLLSTGQEAFVVGCVARNQPRKGFPILMKSFAEFARKHDDAFLHLHTDPFSPDGWQLQDLAHRYGIASRTGFSRTMISFSSMPDEMLRNVYRSFDVFALATMGEGFCLPILEAMSCGIPVIATEGSAVTELLSGRGELIPIVATITAPRYNLEFGLPDTEKLINGLEKLYYDAELRSKYARMGREFAETVTWDAAAEQWKRLLEGAIN